MLVSVADTLPIMMLSGHLSVGARCGLREPGREDRIMDPVTTAAVVTAISSAGTVLAAWVQARAQRPAKRVGRQAVGPDEPGADGRRQHDNRSRASIR